MPTNKTQLICFHAPSVRPIAPTIYFNGTKLSYSDQVVHLGHILTSNLDDTADIMRTVKDMNKKVNFLLCTFHCVDPQVKLKFYCLSLYGCCLWTLSAPSIRVVEVALNKILRKIWRLPPCSHSAIAHCVEQVDTISNLVFCVFSSFSQKLPRLHLVSLVPSSLSQLNESTAQLDTIFSMDILILEHFVMMTCGEPT